MTISPEAKELELKLYRFMISSWEIEPVRNEIQLAINSATAPLQKEIERLRGEVSKAYHEGMLDYSTEGEEFHYMADSLWNNSRAKRVVEGKE